MKNENEKGVSFLTHSAQYHSPIIIARCDIIARLQWSLDHHISSHQAVLQQLVPITPQLTSSRGIETVLLV